MLIIPQCRFCNANKATCSIKQGLKRKLQDAGIKEPMRYICHGWRAHVKYAVGDVIEFAYLVYGDMGYERAEETLTGKIVELNKKRPIYIVTITQDEYNKIDKDYTRYHEKITRYGTYDNEYGFRETEFMGAPVMENLIIRKLN